MIIKFPQNQQRALRPQGAFKAAEEVSDEDDGVDFGRSKPRDRVALESLEGRKSDSRRRGELWPRSLEAANSALQDRPLSVDRSPCLSISARRRCCPTSVGSFPKRAPSISRPGH